MKVEAFYIIRQGGREVRTKENHFTDYMVKEWMRCLSNHYDGGTKVYRGTGNQFVIGFGDNTNTATSPTQTTLVGIVSYKADTRSFIDYKEESSGVWICKYGATWNANHFSENKTLAEVGIHFDANPPTTDTGTPTDRNESAWPVMFWDGSKLASRCSVADGDFTAITVDYTLPLSIEYWIRLKYV